MTTLADHIEDFLADLGRRRNWRNRTIQLCASNPIPTYARPQQDRRLPRPIRTQQERTVLGAATMAAPSPTG